MLLLLSTVKPLCIFGCADVSLDCPGAAIPVIERRLKESTSIAAFVVPVPDLGTHSWPAESVTIRCSGRQFGGGTVVSRVLRNGFDGMSDVSSSSLSDSSSSPSRLGFLFRRSRASLTRFGGVP